MPKYGKKYQDVVKLIEKDRLYDAREAFDLVKKTGTAKFDETIEVAIKLGVDPRHADQQVRGTVVLPNGTGKDVRVLVFAKGEKASEAEKAGADYVGAEELVEKIQGGWLDFDVAIATPDMMGLAGKLGRILGPRSLMPNPKTGTVTFEVARAVQESKAGKIEYRVDKAAVVHVPLGKISFEAEKLYENFDALLGALIKAKPAASKGQYVRQIYIAATMGPGIAINPQKAVNK